ncbi:secretoglobin family 1D member 2-like [Fukomys damarensis]|uniref:secretoglobin family 1D member 2-like n=1 Tax=Fukomys damarensis TaxID=885580 RepID=UPI00053FDB77|nr:secretoglobin family 1D member 2-like [Fukomys damarensis]
MKLCVPLLLVALGLCFYEANAVPCPAVLKETVDFLMLSKPFYKLSLAKFNASAEVVAAKMLVKDCVDEMDLLSRTAVVNSLNKVAVRCI